jgi:hypothetical protein
LAVRLKAYLADKPLGQPVWPGTWHQKAAEMLRIDLEAAGIPFAVPGPDGRPLAADFHALRHTLGVLAEQGGATLREVMALMRHSDPKLTLKNVRPAPHPRPRPGDRETAIGDPTYGIGCRCRRPGW